MSIVTSGHRHSLRAANRFAWSLLPLAGIGCDAASPAVPLHTTRDSAGIVIVENVDHSIALRPVVRLYRIGSVDGPDALYRVTHTFLMDDAGVAAVESGSDSIRFFDSRGAPVGGLGGRGEGPGEFTGLWWAARGPADTIVAFDIAGGGSVSIFEPAAGFVCSFPLPRVGHGEPVVIGSWPDGTLLVLMQTTGVELQPGQLTEYGLYTVARDGSVDRDLGRWAMGMYRGAYEIFAHRAAFAAGGHHLLYSPGDRFEVRVHARDGTLERIVRVDRARDAVHESDVEAFREGLRAWATDLPNPEGALRRMQDAVVADSMPGYTALLAASDRGFLARRAGAYGDTTSVWDVFDGDGVYRGRLELPATFFPRSVDAGYIAGTSLDENDVEFIDVYRWSWPDPADTATAPQGT